MKVLGLDVGIASCGWALLDHDAKKILGAGVRIFEKPENPKDGMPLAQQRRKARLARRTLRRRKDRLRRLRSMLRTLNVVDGNTGARSNPNVWSLRLEGLERALSGQELLDVLHHIGKRRGFRSSKKLRPLAAHTTLDGSKPSREGRKTQGASFSLPAEDEEGPTLAAVRTLNAEFRASGKRTVGEYLNERAPNGLPFQVPSAWNRKLRNDKDEYIHTVPRSLLEDEVQMLLTRQRDFGRRAFTPEAIEQIKRILFDQRPMSGIEHLVGPCPFEPDEKRCPKRSVEGEEWVLLQRFNAINLEGLGGEARRTPEQIARLRSYIGRVGKVTYKHFAECLDLPDWFEFPGVDYVRTVSPRRRGTRGPVLESVANLHPTEKERRELVTKRNRSAAVMALPFSTALRSLGITLEDADDANHDRLGRAAWIISAEKDLNRRLEALLNIGIGPECAEPLAELSFSGFLGVSSKAIKKMLPHLRVGMLYHEAAASAGYDHSKPRRTIGARQKRRIPPFEGISNQVVSRALSECRRVVNAIVAAYGVPDEIVVELGRDIGKSFQERMEIENDQKRARAENDDRRTEWMTEFGFEPTGSELRKLRLYREQGAKCPYSHRPIDLRTLKDGSALEIDHIRPYSRSFDDSLSNQVLVYSSVNQEKGNRTPYEWFGKDSERWEHFRTQNRHLPARKRQKLFSVASSPDEWKARALNDTRYIARELAAHIERHLYPKPEVHGRRRLGRVCTTRGAITAKLRRLWGLEKHREENHLHHGVDAMVIACVTNRIEQILTVWAQKKEMGGRRPGSLEARLPLPWDSFRTDVIEYRDKHIFVSRRATVKDTGRAHEETVRSRRSLSGLVVERVLLRDVTPATLELLVDKEGRNAKLYRELADRLSRPEFGGDPKKAFADPFCISGNKEGTLGARIRRISIRTDQKSGVHVRGQGKTRGGYAPNGDMVRVDIFSRLEKGEKRYFLIPVYAHHMSRPFPPLKAIQSGKREEHWLEIDDNYLFNFSLYPSDLVELEEKDGNRMLGYYVKTHRLDGRVYLVEHHLDNSKQISRGTRTLKNIRKFVVDPLGNRSEVLPGTEKRRWPGKQLSSKAARA